MLKNSVQINPYFLISFIRNRLLSSTSSESIDLIEELYQFIKPDMSCERLNTKNLKPPQGENENSNLFNLF